MYFVDERCMGAIWVQRLPLYPLALSFLDVCRAHLDMFPSSFFSPPAVALYLGDIEGHVRVLERKELARSPYVGRHCWTK